MNRFRKFVAHVLIGASFFCFTCGVSSAGLGFPIIVVIPCNVIQGAAGTWCKGVEQPCGLFGSDICLDF